VARKTKLHQVVEWRKNLGRNQAQFSGQWTNSVWLWFRQHYRSEVGFDGNIQLPLNQWVIFTPHLCPFGACKFWFLAPRQVGWKVQGSNLLAQHIPPMLYSIDIQFGYLQLDWYLGNSEARATPWTLHHVGVVMVRWIRHMPLVWEIHCETPMCPRARPLTYSI